MRWRNTGMSRSVLVRTLHFTIRNSHRNGKTKQHLKKYKLCFLFHLILLGFLTRVMTSMILNHCFVNILLPRICKVRDSISFTLTFQTWYPAHLVHSRFIRENISNYLYFFNQLYGLMSWASLNWRTKTAQLK